MPWDAYKPYDTNVQARFVEELSYPEFNQQPRDSQDQIVTAALYGLQKARGKISSQISQLSSAEKNGVLSRPSERGWKFDLEWGTKEGSPTLKVSAKPDDPSHYETEATCLENVEFTYLQNRTYESKNASGEPQVQHTTWMDDSWARDPRYRTKIRERLFSRSGLGSEQQDRVETDAPVSAEFTPSDQLQSTRMPPSSSVKEVFKVAMQKFASTWKPEVFTSLDGQQGSVALGYSDAAYAILTCAKNSGRDLRADDLTFGEEDGFRKLTLDWQSPTSSGKTSLFRAVLDRNANTGKVINAGSPIVVSTSDEDPSWVAWTDDIGYCLSQEFEAQMSVATFGNPVDCEGASASRSNA